MVGKIDKKGVLQTRKDSTEHFRIRNCTQDDSQPCDISCPSFEKPELVVGGWEIVLCDTVLALDDLIIGREADQ